MNDALRFKAQALDNASPDEYQAGGAILTELDQLGRRRITEEISSISRLGRIYLKDDGAELIIHGDRFLVQVISQQRDSAGRRAAILCCGDLSAELDPERRGAALVTGLRAFATAIERSVEPGHLEAVHTAIAKVTGERGSRRLFIALAVVAVATAGGVALSVRHAEPASEAHGQTR